MRSLKLEQVAVIKFLTLEEVKVHSIYKRLKKIFKQYTLPKEKVLKLNIRFSKEGLLGFQDNPVYVEERKIPRLQDGNCDEEQKLDNADDVLNNASPFTSITEYKPFAQQDEERENESSCDDNKIDYRKQLIWKKHKPPVSYSKYTLQNIAKNLRKLSSSPHFEFDENFLRSIELPFLPVISSYQCEELLAEIHRSTNLKCLLCENKTFRVFSKLKRHLRSAHISHSVILATVRSLHCKKHCCNPNKQTRPSTTRAHYHCPLCSWYFFCRQRLIRHYSTHLSQAERYSCPAEVEIWKFRCIGIDNNDGIFLVCRSRFGNMEPVHVMKKVDSNGEVIHSECSEELCQEAMLLAKKNGNSSLECKHLASVNLKANFQLPHSYFTLKEELFKNLNYPLNAEEFQACMAISEVASQMNTPLLVEWVETDTVIFFSIFCDEPFAKMGRILVKLDLELGNFSCKCPLFNSSHFCPYKVISEIYFLCAR